MSELNIETLKKIIENIPGDFTVEFVNGKNNYFISDKFMVDLTEKKVKLTRY